MAPPVAAPLSLIKVPTDNAKNLINSEDTGWEGEEVDEEYNPENALDGEDASLFDPSDTHEEEDLGIPLSQHAPPHWNDNTVIIDQEDEPQSLIPNSESQRSNWGDADIDDDGEEAEETAWEEEEEVLPQAN